MGLSRRQFLKLCGAGAIGIGMFSFDCFANPQRGGLEGVFRIDENIIETIESNLESSKSVTHYAYKLLKNNDSLRFHDIGEMERMVDTAELKTRRYLPNPRSKEDKINESITALFFLGKELHEKFSYKKYVFDCFDFALPHLALVDRLDLPVYPVNSPLHLFLRIDFNGKHDPSNQSLLFLDNQGDINFEPIIPPSNGMIHGHKDGYFIEGDRIPDTTLTREIYVRGLPKPVKSVYLRNLSNLELIGIVFDLIASDILRESEPRWEDSMRNDIYALNLFPDFPEALSNLGRSFIGRDSPGDYDKAEKCLNRAIELYPTSAIFYNNKGKILERDKPEEARIYYDKAISLHPAYAEPYNNKGNLCLNTQNYTEAEKLFRKALEINPNYEDALYNLKLVKEMKNVK